MTLNEVRTDFMKGVNHDEFAEKISDEMINNFEFYNEVFFEGNKLIAIEANGCLSDFDAKWKDLLDEAWRKHCLKFYKKMDEKLEKAEKCRNGIA